MKNDSENFPSFLFGVEGEKDALTVDTEGSLAYKYSKYWQKENFLRDVVL